MSINPFPIILNGQFLVGESLFPAVLVCDAYISDGELKNIQTITEADVRYIAHGALQNISGMGLK